MGSESYHEPFESLSPETRDVHRAIVSLQEELEAIDWYNQRADVTKDAHLKAILQHNRDEEIEHACMVLEWVRRTLPKFDEELRTYLFSQGDVTTLEDEEEGGDGEEGGGEHKEASGPTVGSLR